MAKLLSYTFPIIGNRLRRDESACRARLENAGSFETVISDSRSKMSPAEQRASQVSGQEIYEKVQAFFARPGSSDRILGSLKPRGYAGVQGLATLIITDVCTRVPSAPIPTGPASQQPHSATADPPKYLDSAEEKDGVMVRDVRPWLLPEANYFPLVACKYFVYGRGRCHKEDECTFLHQAPSDYIPPPGYGADKVQDAIRKLSQERRVESSGTVAGVQSNGVDSARTARKRPLEESLAIDRRSEDRNRDERRRGDYSQDARRSDNIRDIDRAYNRPRQDNNSSYTRSRSRSPRRSDFADRYDLQHCADAAQTNDLRLPARRDDDRSFRRDNERRGDEREPHRLDRDGSRRAGVYSRDGLYDSYRPSNSGGRTSPRDRDMRRTSNDISDESEVRNLRRHDEISSPTTALSSSQPTDPFKNAENLLEKAINASESGKVQQISMLDRYLTLQSKMAKTENNIQIYEYLLSTIEGAPTARRHRYLKFLHSYLALINRNTADFDPMGAMMNLAEQSTGEVQARAVPLLDRYMNLASAVDLGETNGEL